MGENAPKLTKQIHLTNQCGLRVIMNMVNNKKVKVMVKEAVEKGKEVTTNENGLIVELELKNSKAQ